MLFYFALISALLAIILSIYNWRVNKNTFYISGILIILSAHGLTHYFTDPSQSDFSLALFYGNLSPFWLLPGPLLYFYFRSTLYPKESKWSVKDLPHFVPFVIQLINIFPYLTSSFDYKLYVAHAIHQNLNSLQTLDINSLYSFKFSLLSRPVIMLAYLIWCSLLILRQKGSLIKSKQTWLVFFLVGLLIPTIAYLYVALNLFNEPIPHISINNYPTYFVSGIAYIALPIILITLFPEVLFGIKRLNLQQVENGSNSTEVKIDYYLELTKKIDQYCHNEKPYLRPDFEIADLAEAMKVPKLHVSNACRYAYNMRFTEIRNHMRVEHAKQLLQNGMTKNNTIDAIGTISGFKSRSTFYEAFKAETGMTPSQYLENLA